PLGGMGALNVLIPATLDDTALAQNGRGGVVPNTKTGMRGLFIDAQPTTAGYNAVYLSYSGGDAAMRIYSQPTPFPSGNGHGIILTHAGAGNAINIVQLSGTGIGLSIQRVGGIGAMVIYDSQPQTGSSFNLLNTTGTYGFAWSVAV